MTKPTLKMTLMTIVWTVFYFTVAIFCEGGMAAFFSKPALAGLVVVTVVIAGAGLFSGISFGAGVREDRGNRWVVPALGLTGILGACLPPWTDRIGFWTFGGDGIRWIGLATFTCGSVVRVGSAFVLGRRFSPLVTIQEDHALLTGGVYGVVRHPSYLGLVVSTIGIGLVFRSGIGLLLALVTLVIILFRIDAEEKFLRTEFGEAYDAYRARTARLVPGLY